jgi:hypothetical protein
VRLAPQDIHALLTDPNIYSKPLISTLATVQPCYIIDNTLLRHEIPTDPLILGVQERTPWVDMSALRRSPTLPSLGSSRRRARTVSIYIISSSSWALHVFDSVAGVSNSPPMVKYFLAIMCTPYPSPALHLRPRLHLQPHLRPLPPLQVS